MKFWICLVMGLGFANVGQAQSIMYGDDSSERANDGECDDFRFEGQDMSPVVLSENIGRDASDCCQLCRDGVIALRDY